LPINHDETPIRLFQSDFLEFFTHITPAVVLIIWLPVATFLIVKAFIDYSGPGFPVHIPYGFVLGLFLWTFAEYTLHRYIFHYKPRSPRQERIVFLFHGVHHAQPQCKTRLVMPPAVSVPVSIIFYGLFSLVVGGLLKAPQWVLPLLGGFMVGYLIYDMIHYATHHARMRSPVLKFLKRHHMRHHYKTPDQRFGVSTPLWDIVFGTLPAD
jgi:sterol desaturase/sphingolipid hydroxylase (fatty acid hydroxylase superfamily)